MVKKVMGKTMGVNRSVNKIKQYVKRTYLYKWWKTDWRKFRNYKKLERKLLPLHDAGSTKNKEKKFLIISGIGMDITGLFCDMLAFIKWVRFAEDAHYIPVIDMKNIPNIYLEDHMIGQVNSWEYFFKQPAGISLEEAYSSQNIRVVNHLDCPWNFSKEEKDIFQRVYNNDWAYGKERENLPEWKRLYQSNFILNDETAKYVEEVYQKLFAGREKVLGVLCRGTDYINSRPYGHDIQPTFKQLKEKITEIIKSHQCGKIFVATEDLDMLNKLKEAFTNRILYVECDRCTTSGKKSVASAFSELKVDKKKNRLDYLTSVYLLARCNCLIAGKTSATPFISLIRNHEYEYEFYWELGKYGIDD